MFKKKIVVVLFSKLVPLSFNPKLRKENIKDLTKSFYQYGMIIPLIVIPKDDGTDTFEILEGNRRYYAIKSIIDSMKVKIENYELSKNPQYQIKHLSNYNNWKSTLSKFDNIDCLVLDEENAANKISFYHIINTVIKKHSGNEQVEAYLNCGDKSVCANAIYNNLNKISSVLYNHKSEDKLDELKKIFVDDKISYKTFMQMWSLLARAHSLDTKITVEKLNKTDKLSKVTKSTHKKILDYLLTHSEHLIDIRNNLPPYSREQIQDYVSKKKLLKERLDNE